MAKRFWTIAKYPEYSFTDSGELWHNDPAYRILPKSENGINVLEFESGDLIYKLNELDLFIELYFGTSIDLPVVFRDKNPLNLDSTNIYFDIPFETQVLFESPYTIFVSLGSHLFRRIPGYTQYFISDNGLVYSTNWRKIMTVHPDKDGYNFIRIVSDTEKRKVGCRIHRLVYTAFIGQIPDKYVIDHYDGTRTNNSITNLSAMPASENTLKGHSYDMKRESIKPETVNKICAGIQSGKALEEIFVSDGVGSEFSNLQVFTNFCLGLVRGYFFRDVSNKYDLRNFHYSPKNIRHYRKDQIKDICKLLNAGKSKSEVSKILGIPMSTIKNVYGRYSWREVSTILHK